MSPSGEKVAVFPSSGFSHTTQSTPYAVDIWCPMGIEDEKSGPNTDTPAAVTAVSHMVFFIFDPKVCCLLPESMKLVVH